MKGYNFITKGHLIYVSCSCLSEAVLTWVDMSACVALVSLTCTVRQRDELQQWVFDGDGVYRGDLQSGSETVRRGWEFTVCHNMRTKGTQNTGQMAGSKISKKV